MGPAGFTLGPCKVCFDIVWNCNADENMIIIQTFDARPWVHDRGQVGHHPWVVPRRSLDSHWVFLDSTCMSRRVQAAICPRNLKASKVCNCIQKQAVDPMIDRWAKVFAPGGQKFVYGGICLHFVTCFYESCDFENPKSRLGTSWPPKIKLPVIDVPRHSVNTHACI